MQKGGGGTAFTCAPGAPIAKASPEYTNKNLPVWPPRILLSKF